MANPPPRIGLWRSRTPDPGDFDSLLNLIPEAALLVDKNRNNIQITNSALLKLCAYTQNELRNQSIIELIPDFAGKPMDLGDEYAVMLNRRKRDPIAVRLKVAAILSEGQLVLSLSPEQIQLPFSISEQPSLFHQLFEFTKMTDDTAFQPAIEQVVELTRLITGCEIISIYQADPTYPQLKRIAFTNNCECFPDLIPSTDLIRLAQPTMWRPGKRVITELHRAGKVANLVFVATSALGQENALCGLMAVGDPTHQPREDLLLLLDFIGDMVGGIVQKNMLMVNLQREIDRLKDQISIHTGLFENCHDGVVVVDPEMIIQNINPTIEAMLGYANAEVKGKLAENILIGAEGLALALEHAVQGIPTHNLGSISLHRRDGHAFPVNIQTIPVQNDGQMMAILILVEDITATEQIRLRTQQLEHRAVLGEFTAIFAHEVRNPINNISAGLQLLASQMDANDAYQSAVIRMMSDCSRLDHLMESVLSFSRPMENTFYPVDMNQLLQRLLDRWHPRLARVNVKLSFQPVETLPKIIGDMRSLEQVFTNLISNAVEAMSKNGGTLTIRLQPSDIIANRPQVEITVSDNGPGIPDELRERIFDPFVSNSAKGTGLGLAITKRIVTAHQGTIKVNSFPGGTVFHVFLPVYKGA